MIDKRVEEERLYLQAQILLIPNLLNPLSIDKFIQPIKENIVDNNEDIIEVLVERYSIENTEEEESDIEIEKIEFKDAIKALELLKLYEIQQEDGKRSNLQALDRISRSILQRRI